MTVTSINLEKLDYPRAVQDAVDGGPGGHIGSQIVIWEGRR